MGSMITMFGCGQQTTKYSVSEYPETRKDAVVDEYFGTKVADIYAFIMYNMGLEYSLQ